MPEFKPCITCLFLIVSSLLLLSPNVASSSDENNSADEVFIQCGTDEYADLGPTKFTRTFMALMDTVSVKIKEQGWSAESIINPVAPIFALAECRNDLNNSNCYKCFNHAREYLSQCLPKVAGRVYMDGCFLRYDNYGFFNEMEYNSTDSNNSNATDPAGFREKVGKAVTNVTETAATSVHKFAVNGDNKDVFALAQCWHTLDREGCERCLKRAERKLSECIIVNDEGKSMLAGCFLKYSTRKFYGEEFDENGVKNNYDNSYNKVIIVSLSSAVAVTLIIITGVMVKKKKAPICTVGMDRSKRFEYVAGYTFKYELLEKATNYFDPACKLGQGGAGSVFKGTLPQGKTVAVKRLFFTTRQWTDGFFNEVNSITGITHKNVVKLLGCSIEGPESLLVYEFVPNGSLEQILFGRDSTTFLTWKQRFNIICGVAEALAYLHGGTESKIIHRDIKSGNILLDENLDPKIADFGLARFVTENRSHVTTGIAGTLGYMAPEYLLQGQLTEKADVYAFGVVVAEVVCGKKNSVYTQGSTSVLHCIWKNYKAQNITASVDPALNGQFVEEEASNALKAALLCTQSSVSLRPSMSQVLQILTDKDFVVPSPRQRPFLNCTMLSLDDRTQATSTFTLTPETSPNGPTTTSARSSFHTTTDSFSSNTHAINIAVPSDPRENNNNDNNNNK
ncbi:cysteine-rich receptor-like protein kinase 1 [Arachis stenosperma]|uniref:cysteine-rich receptor-like protein kinase 1 n=1 Tax=Arachis stenosperma TaxID=217475 RepID=UPI0025ACA1F1|nr:cysteine-rich receptor-like protein kinase 1 [Arachis stenosperma]